MPICAFPRWDFLLLAANQLVNHLDKIPLYSQFRPKVIIRTAIGATKPLNPGPQHCQDHSKAFELMLKTVTVVHAYAGSVMATYKHALEAPHSVIVVEDMKEYG